MSSFYWPFLCLGVAQNTFQYIFYLALIKHGRGFWAPEEESLVHNLINLPTDGSTYAALNGSQNPLICSVSVYYAKNGNCSRPSQESQWLMMIFAFSRAGNRLFFWVNRSFFAKKWANKRLAKKKTSNSLMVSHLWWATWAIRSHCSILVSDLTSLIKKEGMSESLIKKK